MRLSFAAPLLAAVAALPAHIAPLLHADTSAVAAPRISAPVRAEAIAPNDNRRAAGTLANGVLTLALEARAGIWDPHGAGKRALPTAAFAEVGRPLQTPGPLVRVPVGTQARISVRNALAKTLWVYGLGATRGATDSVRIEPGATHTFTPRFTEAGTWWYAARTDSVAIGGRIAEDSQLGGAIIVDPVGARPNDRIFVITTWFTIDPGTKSGLGADPSLAFNGRSYPATEPMRYAEGDSVRWRFVNLSSLEHPLHLHGFYYRVDAHGTGQRDTLFSPDARRMVVTELLTPMQTMAMAFSPTRRGNWVLHCHVASHIMASVGFEADRTVMTPDGGHAAHDGSDPMHHMEGLVLRFDVTPKGNTVARETAARPLRLLLRSKAKVYGDYVGYAFVDGNSPAAQNPDTMPVPGPVLHLVKGERVAITLVNRTHEPAAVHWHGIELESYPDGVPGISGEGKTLLPFIPPGDSLTVRFTPPRAGTFMYHSHSNEMQQIGSGMYGAIVVHDKGAPPDPARDRVLLFSENGPFVSFLDPSKFPAPLLNGQLAPAPIEVPAGVPVRLRLINIRAEFPLTIGLYDGDTPSTWRLLAKDGFEVPAAQATVRPSTLLTNPGEITDVEITLPAGATRTLRYEMPGLPPELTKAVRVQVRAR